MTLRSHHLLFEIFISGQDATMNRFPVAAGACQCLLYKEGEDLCKSNAFTLLEHSANGRSQEQPGAARNVPLTDLVLVESAKPNARFCVCVQGPSFISAFRDKQKLSIWCTLRLIYTIYLWHLSNSRHHTKRNRGNVKCFLPWNVWQNLITLTRQT